MSTVVIDQIDASHTGSRLRFEGGEGVLVRARRTRRGTKLTMNDDAGRRFVVEASGLELDVISSSSVFDGSNIDDLAAFASSATGNLVEACGMWCDERECRIAVVMLDQPLVDCHNERLVYDGVRFCVEPQAVTAKPSAARTYRRR